MAQGAVTTQATMTQAVASGPSESALNTEASNQAMKPINTKLLKKIPTKRKIMDLVMLDDNMMLVAIDSYPWSKMKLFDVTGEKQDTYRVKGQCELCKSEGNRVFVLDKLNYKLEMLLVEDAEITSKSTKDLQGKNQMKCYNTITALHNKTMAVTFGISDSNANKGAPRGIDVMNWTGKVLKTIKTKKMISYMCVLPEGQLIGVDTSDNICKFDLTSGTMLLKTKVPQIPDPCGLTFHSNGKILVGGGSEPTLSVVDEKGKFIQEIFKSPPGSNIGQVAVQDDICICEVNVDDSSEDRAFVYVIKLIL